MKDILKDRYIIIFILFALFIAFLLYNLYDLQVVRGERFYTDSRNRVFRERKVAAPRGIVMDRNAIPIAYSDQGYTVSAIKTEASSSEFNNSLHLINTILSENGDIIYSKLDSYMQSNPMDYKTDKETIRSWQKRVFDIDNEDFVEDADAFFAYIRKKDYLDIEENYNNQEAFAIARLKYEVYINEWLYSINNHVVLVNDVSLNSIAAIEERHHMLSGLTTGIIPVRKYLSASLASHVIGYVGKISAEQYKEMEGSGYKSNDIVGKTGIELSFEKELKGTDGMMEVEEDTKGRLTNILSEIPAIPGNNIILNIDLNLQRVALESLERNIDEIKKKVSLDNRNHQDADSGAVVVMDVNTGEILAMASYPGYDPSLFINQYDKEAQNKVYEWITDNENRPLINRAIQNHYAPGSTYKPIVGIAALEEGIITDSTEIIDEGKVEIGGHMFYCLEHVMGLGAHGALTFEKALTASCNIFFHIVGVDTTIDKIDKWAEYFGLGELTGINLPFEMRGNRSNREFKKKAYGEDWWIADTAQSSIGQLYNEFTPLQLARYTAAIANGGKLLKPLIVNSIISPNGEVVEKMEPQYEIIPISEETIDTVRKGMKSVAQSVDGTAERIFRDFKVEVAGKTGTAETGEESTSSSNALFVCYAPADDPQIAIAVVIEKGVWGSNTAPVAKDIMDAYFDLYSDTQKKQTMFIP